MTTFQSLDEHLDPYQLAILRALNATGKHIYGGTVPSHVVERRRAANRVARASRKANR